MSKLPSHGVLRIQSQTRFELEENPQLPN